MSKEYSEPLLPKSPPSPVYGSKDLDPGLVNTKIIMIHHWSDYDQGMHKVNEIEISQSHRVLDIIMISINQFY